MGGRIISTIRLCCCLIILFVSNCLSGQTVLEGVVTDDHQNPVPAINVLAKKSDNVVSFTYTDEQGKYSIVVSQTGNFTLEFNALAYRKKSVEILLDGKQKSVNLNVQLEVEETQLDEVIVQADQPITVKQDTIIFDAAAFSRGDETVVEDLLRNIPGLTIDDNGRITVEGKEVEKVMVNYADFFDKGYTILTKNMPSHTIDKVEVLQHYSNNRLLKGIEDSERVALNLKLEENYKNVWFGDAALGYDITGGDKYDGKANLMSFGDKQKHYFLGSLNNTGMDVSGDLSYVVRPNRFDEPGSLGNDQSVTNLFNLTGNSFGLKKERTNFNNVKLLSLNSIFNITPKIKLKATGLLNTNVNDFYRDRVETYLLNNQSFTNTENYELGKNSFKGFGELNLTYDISGSAMFEFTSKYNNANDDTKTHLQFNENSSKETLNARNQLIDHKAVYSNKLRENTVLILTGRYIDEEIPEKYRTNQFLFQNIFPEAEGTEYIFQSSKNQILYTGLEAHLINKKEDGNLLELKSGYTSTQHLLKSQLFLEEEDITHEPEDYGNDIHYNTNKLYLNGRFTYKFHPFSLIGQLDLQQYFNTLQDKNENMEDVSPFFLNPRLGVEWSPNERNKLQAFYSYNTTNADILDVYSGYVLTNYRNFSKGTGEQDPTITSGFQLKYSLGNWKDSFFVSTSLGYNRSHDYFSYNMNIQPTYSQASKVLIKDRNLFLGNVTADRYFESLATNLKINIGLMESEYGHIVNSEQRNIEMLNYQYGLEFRSGFTGIFNFNVGTNWRHTEVRAGVNNSFTNNITFLNLNFNMSSELNLNLESERYYFGNLSNSENEYYFLDLNAKYEIIKNKLALSLQGKNLTNTRTFRNFSVNDISIQSTQYRLLPRYVLLKATYRF